MKELKALEILYKIDTEYKYAQLNSDSCIRSDFINEAIKELEELNNRSCDNCEYCKNIYSYTYPLCVYNENEPFQLHKKRSIKM